MTRLTVKCAREGHYTVKLSATVEAGGFSGSGHAWFNSNELFAFCKAMRAYPLDPESLPSIRGGYGERASDLSEVHLSLRIEPSGGAGVLKVIVELGREDEGRRVRTWFAVGYNDLDRFSADLLRSDSRGDSKATLTSTLG